MRYRNTKNGAVIDVTVRLAGSWVPVEDVKPAEEKPAKKPVKKRTVKK